MAAKLETILSRTTPSDGCLVLTRSVKPDGYAIVRVGKLFRQAHRVVYELVNGKINSNLVIDHLCRVRNCVNPEHLEAVTQRENTLRSPIAITAVNSRKTHCNHGHEFNEKNTYYRSDRPAVRGCKACRYVAHRKYIKGNKK